MATKQIFRVGMLVAAVWVGFGIAMHAPSNYAAMGVSDVIDAPERYNNQLVTLRGTVRMGLEMGDIVSEGAKRVPLPGAAICMDLADWLAIYINRATFDSVAVVRGTIAYKSEGGLGTYGLYELELRDARFVRWPEPVALALLFFLYLFPGMVLTLVCFRGLRKAAVRQ